MVPRFSSDVLPPDAVPYFNWDGPITNAAVREALAHGTDDDRRYWRARILREARHDDVWAYLSRRDVIDGFAEVAPQLGRRRPF